MGEGIVASWFTWDSFSLLCRPEKIITLPQPWNQVNVFLNTNVVLFQLLSHEYDAYIFAQLCFNDYNARILVLHGENGGLSQNNDESPHLFWQMST